MNPFTPSDRRARWCLVTLSVLLLAAVPAFAQDEDCLNCHTDKDALLKAINEEYTWEFHPLLPLERYMGPTIAPQVAVLYRPPTFPDQMWLFYDCPLLPVETFEMRAVGGRMMMLGRTETPIRMRTAIRTRTPILTPIPTRTPTRIPIRTPTPTRIPIRTRIRIPTQTRIPIRTRIQMKRDLVAKLPAAAPSPAARRSR